MPTPTDLAHQWARDIATGKRPANKRIVQACQRQLGDLARVGWRYVWDAARADRVCRFIEALPHIKGAWAGTNIVLQPWQCFNLAVPFGWIDRETGRRRFRVSFSFIPRKNSKSTMAAGVGLYGFLADGEGGAEVYSGATTEKQAWETFGPARLMVLKANGLRVHFGVDVGAKNLAILNTAAKFEPVIGKPGDGSMPHIGIVDEYHEHATSALYDTFITGMGSRAQAMQWVVTTAGSNVAGPCRDLYKYAGKVLDGTLENETFFALIFELDGEDSWEDFDNWRKVNPNFGVSIYEDYLRDRHREAIQSASRQNILRCKHLNQWMSSNSAWINPIDWNGCAADDGKTLDDFAGQPCYLGLDLASKVDIAALMLVFKDGDRWRVFGRYYLPEDTIDKPEKQHYRTWRTMGLLTETPGAVIDYGVIKDDIRDLSSRFQVECIAYDPWQATQLAKELSDEGCKMVELRPTVANFSEPMKATEALILERKLVHTGDPALAWMVSNVVCHTDAKDNIYPRKEHQDEKIDGLVALLMAFNRALLNDDDGPSSYEAMAVEDML